MALQPDRRFGVLLIRSEIFGIYMSELASGFISALGFDQWSSVK